MAVAESTTIAPAHRSWRSSRVSLPTSMTAKTPRNILLNFDRSFCISVVATESWKRAPCDVSQTSPFDQTHKISSAPKLSLRTSTRSEVFRWESHLRFAAKSRSTNLAEQFCKKPADGTSRKKQVMQCGLRKLKTTIVTSPIQT